MPQVGVLCISVIQSAYCSVRQSISNEATLSVRNVDLEEPPTTLLEAPVKRSVASVKTNLNLLPNQPQVGTLSSTQRISSVRPKSTLERIQDIVPKGSEAYKKYEREYTTRFNEEEMLSQGQKDNFVKSVAQREGKL